ncbi:MAG: PGPGW domain-containing protein, partial [Burkholderiales bacterium]
AIQLRRVRGLLVPGAMFDIVHATPGRRFQQRHRRKSQSERGRMARWAVIFAGVALTTVGVFFLAVPGPGIPILAIGLALIAQESAATARFLDRTELRLRRWWRRLRS